MVACEAYRCRSRSIRHDPGVTFHRFPKDPNLRNLWVRAVCRKDSKTGKIWQPNKHSRLCSKHFAEDMFDRKYPSRVRLHKNAVPEIFDAVPKHLQMKVEKFEVVESNHMDNSQSAKTESNYIFSDDLSQNNSEDCSSSRFENQECLEKSPSFSYEESYVSESEEPTSAELTKNSHLNFVKALLNKHAEVVDSGAQCTDKQYDDILFQAHFINSESSVTSSKSASSSEDEDNRLPVLSKTELKYRISILEANLVMQIKRNKLLQECNRKLQQEVEKLRSDESKAKSRLLKK